MERDRVDLLAEVAEYYSSRLAEYGATPRGVDWNGPEGQILRFEQLIKVIGQPSSFTLNDLGCGYGALYDYLQTKYHDFSYTGCDVSADMISAARARGEINDNAKYVVSDAPPEIADYGVASGIFNVRLGRRDIEWHEYIMVTLDVLDRTSRLGFAFNCLSSYSDKDKMRGHLYYADPCVLSHYCKKKYSRHVALLHDYGLYEFTIIVRKNP